MRIKEGYIIKKLGSGYVVVTVGQAGKDFNGMIRLNTTGAFLWNRILEGDDSRQKIIRSMTGYYAGLDEETAGADLEEFLDKISFAIEE